MLLEAQKLRAYTFTTQFKVALFQLTSTPPSVCWFQQQAELMLKPTSDFSMTATFTTSLSHSKRECRVLALSWAISVAHF